MVSPVVAAANETEREVTVRRVDCMEEVDDERVLASTIDTLDVLKKAGGGAGGGAGG